MVLVSPSDADIHPGIHDLDGGDDIDEGQTMVDEDLIVS